MRLTRRALLQMGGAAAIGMTGAMSAAAVARRAPGAATPGASAPGSGKMLSLSNLHTGETSELVYFRDDAYVVDSMTAIQKLLRDFRNGAQHAIDPKLMDYLYGVAKALGTDPVFAVISGYRSPQTNEQLRERSSGVARHSLHLEGRAIDVRLAGVDCAELADRARGMGCGGVGYYRKSDFVHLDTGAVRTWNG